MVLLAAVCFATTGTAQALGPEGASPVAVGAVRIAVGAALLLLVALHAGAHPLTVRPRRIVLVAALGVAAYQVTFFAGVRLTGVAVGTVVALGSAPVLTGVLEWLVLRRSPTPRWAAATGLATAGVAVLAGTGAEVDPWGVLCALGAGASYATYSLASKALLDAGHAADAVMAAAFGLGAVLLLPSLLVVPVGWVLEPRGAAMALFLGLVPTALAYWLYARGLRRVPAAEAATLVLAEPATAALLGIVLLGEPFTASFAAGAALLVTAIAVLVRRPAPAATGEAPAPAGAAPEGGTTGR